MSHAQLFSSFTPLRKRFLEKGDLEEQRQHPHKGPVDCRPEGQPAGGVQRPDSGRGEGPAPTAIEGKLWLARLWWGKGFAAPFFVSVSASSRPGPAAILWRGRHFARPRGAGRWGRGAPCSRGAGLATAPGLPPQKREPARPLCSSPPGSRLGAQALPRRLRRVRGPCEPPKSRREACAGRTIFSAL